MAAKARSVLNSDIDATIDSNGVAGITGAELNVILGDTADSAVFPEDLPGATAKATPVDADTIPLNDSAASNVLKKVTWANVKATLAAVFARLDTAAQVITGGFRVTVYSIGTITTGTVTLDPGNRPLQKYTNNGAHTLAPGTNKGAIILTITNGATAGAITTSGFTKVSGDSFTTTNGHKFTCHVTVDDDGSHLIVAARQ